MHISFSEEEDHSLITVENSGDGLKEEELPHIFDAFIVEVIMQVYAEADWAYISVRNCFTRWMEISMRRRRKQALQLRLYLEKCR